MGGFGVVAAEVRKLAERSQVAAQEIGGVAGSNVEQSTGVAQVNTAMNQMNQITQQNASGSEELTATAEEMSGQSEQLQNLVAFFKVGGSQSTAVA